MANKKLIRKVALGILILVIGLFFLHQKYSANQAQPILHRSSGCINMSKAPWLEELKSLQYPDGLKTSWTKLKPLTISLQDSTQTNLDIEIAMQFIGNIRKELDIREGELREETIRELSQHSPKRLLEDFQKGFLSKDLEKAFNELLGRETSEKRILKVKFTSFNFRYSTIPKITETPLDLASVGALLWSGKPAIEPIDKDSGFENPPTGTSTLKLDRLTLGLFTAPILEWPSRTTFLEVEILCSKELFLTLLEKEDVFKEQTIAHISRYNGFNLIKSFRDRTLQERLKRIYRKELPSSQGPHIFRVYFPTFYMSHPPVSPNFSREGKKMFVIEYPETRK
jgi:flagellar basal body-associated protein FliL